MPATLMRRLAACLAILYAATVAADARLDQARREGEVLWYTAMNVPDAEAVKKPFLARYPFLALTVLRAPGEKVRTRILTEARGNRFTWDVVSFNLLDMDALKRERAFSPDYLHLKRLERHRKAKGPVELTF